MFVFGLCTISMFGMICMVGVEFNLSLTLGCSWCCLFGCFFVGFGWFLFNCVIECLRLIAVKVYYGLFVFRDAVIVTALVVLFD